LRARFPVAMFEEAPSASSIAELPWNVIDTIVMYVDSIAVLGRLATLHRNFDQALDYEPLWERICQVRYPMLHTRYSHCFVDSWRSVLRRESTAVRMRSVGQIVAAGTIDDSSSRVVRHCIDLDFRWWSLGTAGLARIASVLQEGSALCTLDLAGQSLGTKDLSTIKLIVQRAPQLSSLGLSDNRFRGADFQIEISRVLAAAPKLVSVSFSNCKGIDESGALGIANGIMQSRVTSVSIAGTCGGRALPALLKALRANLASHHSCAATLDARDSGVPAIADDIADILVDVSANIKGKCAMSVDLSSSAPSDRGANKLCAADFTIHRKLCDAAVSHQLSDTCVEFTGSHWRLRVPLHAKSKSCCVC